MYTVATRAQPSRAKSEIMPGACPVINRFQQCYCLMSRVAARWLANTPALAAAMLVMSCAVGPDFLHPAAPEITRYTREPLTHTSSTDVASGQRQIFRQGRDIPQEWWSLFKSPALNALIERALQ